MSKAQAFLSTSIKALSAMGERFDAWQNAYTGIGISGRDKTVSTRFGFDCILSPEDLTALYIGDDMAARIVDVVPDEMYRTGFEIVTEDSAEKDEIAEAVRALDVAALFREGERWGRLYGGSVIVLGADDGGNVDEPLREERIATMRPSKVVDCRWVWPASYYTDPRDPKYGAPATYQITTWNGSYGVQTVYVHESRLIFFGGVPTPADKKLQLQGWDFSILQRCYGPLRQFENNFKSLEILLSDASQAVYKVKNLWNIVAEGKQAQITTRMQMIELARSVARAIVIDKDEEDFERKPTSFAGVPDSIDRTTLRLAASAHMPVTVLMGQSPAGMNATGNSDLEWWYNDIKGDQWRAKPKILRYIRLMCLAKDGPTGGTIPEKLDVVFCSLRELTDSEKAEIYSKVAAADVAYIDGGVLLSAEVALSRFTPEGFSQHTVIVREPREAMLKPATVAEDLDPPDVTDPNAPGGENAPGAPKKTKDPTKQDPKASDTKGA